MTRPKITGLSLDSDTCLLTGSCYDICSELFEPGPADTLDETTIRGGAAAHADANIEIAIKACAACPVEAITLSTEDGDLSSWGDYKSFCKLHGIPWHFA